MCPEGNSGGPWIALAHLGSASLIPPGFDLGCLCPRELAGLGPGRACSEAPELLEDSKYTSPWPRARRPLGR